MVSHAVIPNCPFKDGDIFVAIFYKTIKHSEILF